MNQISSQINFLVHMDSWFGSLFIHKLQKCILCPSLMVSILKRVQPRSEKMLVPFPRFLNKKPRLLRNIEPFRLATNGLYNLEFITEGIFNQKAQNDVSENKEKTWIAVWSSKLPGKHFLAMSSAGKIWVHHFHLTRLQGCKGLTTRICCLIILL